MPASAQIFTWRDPQGRLVLSNTRPAPGAELLHSLSTPAAPEAAHTVTEGTSIPGSSRYDHLIAEQAQRSGVRPSLVRAVIQVESGFNPLAVSPKGAMGLMQLMPATARELGVQNPFNPAQNVEGGTKYLRQLLDRYGDDEALALAAYNAGPGAVDRHGQHVPPYRETKEYVSRVNRIAGEGTGEGPAPRATEIFRTLEIIDGRPVMKFSDKPQR
jgi:soluble lytic murein transglycosylase-like protein